MILFRTSEWDFDIHEREATRVSGSYLFYNKNNRKERERLTSRWHKWHKSREEAIEYLYQRCLSEIAHAENQVDQARKRLQKFNELFNQPT